MSEDKGVSPVRPGPNPRPSSPESPKPRAVEDPATLTYATATAESRLRVREIWSGPFRESLAELAAERAKALTRAA